VISLPATTRKVHTRGTHRVCEPEETWERVSPHLAAAGITRVADVTRLDVIGVPVWQAVRPLSRNLSVSQGKGVTPMLARVSAVMEAIELWHAERVEIDAPAAPVREVPLPYVVDSLDLINRNLLGGATVLHWVDGRGLRSARTVPVPREYLEIDHTVADRWHPPLFLVTSNGLSSGNTVEEAVLHGLYEVIERDALARLLDTPRATWPRLDPHSVGGDDAPALIERIRAAGCEVSIAVAPSPTGLPVFMVEVWSPAYPQWFGGAGCHLDREVALCRALTEAVQSRLTAISGARDDVDAGVYTRVTDWCSPQVERAGGDMVGYDDLADCAAGDLADDLRGVVTAVERTTGVEPVAVDLSRERIGIPVVRVVAPGMRQASMH